MLEGNIDFAMYQLAARHFRPPLYVKPVKEPTAAFSVKPDVDSYFVSDDLEQRHGLIKVYTADNAEEEKEVADIMKGIKEISALNLADSEVTVPLDFEQAKVETTFKQYIALFSIPEGRTLLTHVLYLAKQKEFTLEREQAFDILKNGYAQLARALAELHTKKFSPVCTISKYYWKSHMDACQAIVKSLRNYEECVPFNLNDFSEKLIRMAAGAYTKPCSAAFLHGKPMVGAIAYEPFSGSITLMDLEESYHSVDDRGVPCGPSAYDFVWAEASFELQMLHIGAASEAAEIIAEYRQTYKRMMRERFPVQQHLTFYSVLFWLPIYKTLIAKYEGSEKNMQRSEKRVFQHAFKRIEPVLTYVSPKDEKVAS